MSAQQTVSMIMLHDGTPRDAEARERLAGVLGGAGDVGAADDDGVFDVHIEAESFEDALVRVWDAIAESGTDDHLAFLEHPEIPEHWQHRMRAHPRPS